MQANLSKSRSSVRYRIGGRSSIDCIVVFIAEEEIRVFLSLRILRMCRYIR